MEVETRPKPYRIRRLGFQIKPVDSEVAWLIVISCAGLAIFLAVIAASVVVASSAHPGEILSGSADLVRALAWPVAATVLVTAFRTTISAQIPRITKVSLPGGSIELDRLVNEQLQDVASKAQAQSADAIGAISSIDLHRARAIERASNEQSLPEVRNRMLDLAAQYRQVRGSMPSGNDRTRAMSILVAQMRTLGQAAFSFRGELAFSDDPGERLAAIAIGQVQPDPAMLGWLASRVGPTERPFVQYHALQALLMSVRNGDASEAIGFDHAYRTAQLGYDGLSAGERTDRADLLTEIRSEVTRLRNAFQEAP